MINRRIRFTFRDYMQLPESEEKRYELIDGELLMVPSPTTEHQKILGKLWSLLCEFVQEHDLGIVFSAPLDVVLSQEDVLQPDIMFISREREGIITERNIQGAPDLVIEILSPATAERDKTLKKTRYAKFGVRDYWIVDPQSTTIEVLKAGDQGLETVRAYPEDTNVTSPLIQDLRIAVNEVF